MEIEGNHNTNLDNEGIKKDFIRFMRISKD